MSVSRSWSTPTVLAAGGSLPGEPLYPVKRTVEEVQLALTWTPEQRSDLLVSFAERRLEEVVAVCTADDCPEDLLADLGAQTEAAAAEVDRLPEGKRAGLLEKMVALTGRQQEVLVSVLERAPDQARPGLERALERSRHGHQQARWALEKEKGPLPKPPGPPEEPPARPTKEPKPTKELHGPRPAHTPGPQKPAQAQPSSDNGK